MQLKFQVLQEQLATKLASLYFFAGAEEYLVEESISSVVQRAQKDGFSELERYEVSSPEQWSEALLALDSPSLFSSRKILIVQLAKYAFGRTGLDALQKWMNNDDDATLLILRGSNWEYRHKQSAWFKFLVKHAAVVIADPIPITQAMKSITQMAETAGLKLSRDTCEELAILTEGNLAAARQEVERLALSFLNENKTINLEDMTRMNWSLCGAFDAINEATRGNIKRLLTQLEALRRGGVQPLMLVGAIASHLRQVHQLSRGESIRTSYRREQEMNRLADRLGHRRIEDLMIECTHIDGEEKGLIRGDPWASIESILLRIAGREDSPLVEPVVNNLRVDYSS